MSRDEINTSALGRFVRVGGLVGRVGASMLSDQAVGLLRDGPTKRLKKAENLVRNATQALAGHGKVTLRTRAVTNFTIGDTRHRVIASIEIMDDGPGIPRDIQDSIFYPLITGNPEGTGLGLPLAQELISRHGGMIEFESRPGRTVFYVRMPIAEASPI